MKERFILVLVSSLFFASSFAQMTNTRKWRKSQKDSLDQGLLLYEEKNYTIALPIFEALHLSHPKEDFVKYMFGKCALYKSDKYDDAYRVLNEVYAKNKKVQDIHYDLAKAAHLTNRLQEATVFINAFIANKNLSPENKRNANILKRYINNAIYYSGNPTKAEIANVGDAINTVDDEYAPAINADETTLIYTYAGVKSLGGRDNAFAQAEKYGLYGEDIFMSQKGNDHWLPAIPIDNINTISHDGAVSLSNDGQILFVYRDNGDDHGDLYQSFLSGDTYTKPIKLSGSVNSFAWEGHCSLSPDGQTLYFSSDRSGGYGGVDLYKATLQADQSWGNVVNLGDSINTEFDEDAPFIHPDGVTLYFSSKGRTSMGGYDIFKVDLGLPDSVAKFSQNLGYPINSTGDDIYFVLSAQGNNAYYSSGRKGGYGLKDIYQIKTNFEKSPALYVVKGKITDEKKPIATGIKVEMTSKDNKLFKTLSSNSKTGNYLVALPAGADYLLTYTLSGMPPQTLSIGAIGLNGYAEKIYDINFETIDTTNIPLASSEAQTEIRKKTIRFADRYGDITSDGLEFRVQIAAYKYPKNYTAKHLKTLGKVESMLLEDSITRITIGGGFKTLNEAWAHNKKVIRSGQPDSFVTAIYKGKRVYLEALERLGIFKAD